MVSIRNIGTEVLLCPKNNRSRLSSSPRHMSGRYRLHAAGTFLCITLKAVEFMNFCRSRFIDDIAEVDDDEEEDDNEVCADSAPGRGPALLAYTCNLVTRNSTLSVLAP